MFIFVMMGDKENENNKEIVRYKDSNMLYFAIVMCALLITSVGQIGILFALTTT